MSNVEFQESQIVPPTYAVSRTRGGLIGWVQKMGWAQDDEGAAKILIIVAIISVVMAIAIPILFSPRPAEPIPFVPPPPQDLPR